MEKLICEQKESFNEMNKLISNYKRDGNDRKSKPQYFLRKIFALEEIWEPIKERHELLMPQATPDQPYFAENTYTKMNEVYEATIDEFKTQYTAKGGVPLSIGDNSQNAQSSQINNEPINDILLNTGTTTAQPKTIFEIYHNELIDLIIDIERVLKKPSIGYIKTHLDLVKYAWNEFRKSYVENQLKSDQEININFGEVQQLYLEASGKLNDMIHSLEVSKNDSMDLPKLRLLDFDGKGTAWYTFIALFNKMVHDKTTIDDGIKMEYLKTCIKGGAAKLIAHIEPTAENYRVCYELLARRYDNKREVLRNIFVYILNNVESTK